VRRPLVLTGPPAVGKSATGEWLARQRPRGAYIDVDDVRGLVVAGHEAPWRGSEGAAQSLLGAANAAALARNFLASGFDVVVVDVLTPRTATAYRERLSGCLVVRLVVDLAEARRRAGTRPVWLTAEEFSLLHERDALDPPGVDLTVDVTAMDLPAQRAAVAELWAAHPL